MNHRDLARGVTVYPTLMVHWGRGTVIAIRRVDLFGYRTAAQYRVQFENLPEPHWCRARDLRKTPNTKKIDNLARLKAARGTQRTNEQG